MKRFICTLALACGLGAGGAAQAVTIDFEAFAIGVFTGTLIEDGYTLDFSSMRIAVGSPDSAIEIERVGLSAGTLTITRTGGGMFEFDAIDWQKEYGGVAANISVVGYLGGSTVGTDTFTAPGGSSTYSTYLASNLSGVWIDSLVILADRLTPTGGAFDNVVLNAVPVPAPLALIGIGLLGIGAIRRRNSA